MIELSPRHKRILKWLGYPVLALTVFLFTLGWTFPYDRVRDRAIDALSDKYDVTIASVDGTFLPGGVVFKTIMLKTRPTGPDEKPVVLVIDEVELDLSFVELLIGHADLDLTARMGGGTIEGNVQLSSGGLEAELETDDLPLGNLPGVSAAVGLPMGGALDLALELRLPGRKWKNAEGRVTLACAACTVGDGEAKLKMKPPEGKRPTRAAAFAGQGITVPRLDLGDARAEVAITKGLGTIKTFEARSKDGWLKIDGKIEFKDPFGQSAMPGCMTFQLSDDLRKREPDFSNIEFMLPAKAKQADGSFAIPTKGKLSELRWDIKRQCGSSPVVADDGATDGGRPTLGTDLATGDTDRGGRRVMPPVEPPAPMHDAGSANPTATGSGPTADVPVLPAEPALTDKPVGEAPAEPAVPAQPEPVPEAGEAAAGPAHDEPPPPPVE